MVGTDERGHRRITWPSTQIADRLAARTSTATSSCCAASSRTCAGASSAPSCSPPATTSAAELVVTLGRAARRHPAHPADPGHRHRHRARAGRPAQARAVDVRGPDRHRRRLPGRLRPARHPGGVATGPPSRTTSPQPPCPKATLALLGQLEDLLEVSIPLGDLPEDARAWERGVDELAEEDEDVADYVRALEETRDTTDLPEASRRGDRPGVRALPQARGPRTS